MLFKILIYDLCTCRLRNEDMCKTKRLTDRAATQDYFHLIHFQMI